MYFSEGREELKDVFFGSVFLNPSYKEFPPFLGFLLASALFEGKTGFGGKTHSKGLEALPDQILGQFLLRKANESIASGFLGFVIKYELSPQDPSEFREISTDCSLSNMGRQPPDEDRVRRQLGEDVFLGLVLLLRGLGLLLMVL